MNRRSLLFGVLVLVAMLSFRDMSLCASAPPSLAVPAKDQVPASFTEAPKTRFQFSFGPGKAPPGYTRVSPETAYTKERGYGFDLGSKVTAVDRGGDDMRRGGFCTSDKPFFFSVAVPEGNYSVAV